MYTITEFLYYILLFCLGMLFVCLVANSSSKQVGNIAEGAYITGIITTILLTGLFIARIFNESM